MRARTSPGGSRRGGAGAVPAVRSDAGEVIGGGRGGGRSQVSGWESETDPKTTGREAAETPGGGRGAQVEADLSKQGDAEEQRETQDVTEPQKHYNFMQCGGV